MSTSIAFTKRGPLANWGAVLIILMLLLAACTPTETIDETAAVEPVPPTAQSSESAGLPNPASVYCEEQGYRLEMREGEGGVYGVCIFPDGSECDEWAFFRGECQPGEFPAALAEDGWEIYHNDSAGYTIHFPVNAMLEPGHDPVQTVTVRGPMIGDEYWPMIFISHPQDDDAYRIPAGSDLVTWLTEQNLLMTAEQEPAAEVRLEDVAIAGTTAVHTRFERSPQSYAYDKYFLAHDGQLYSIVILHTGDREDWELYNHFLDSFRFDA